MCSVPNPSSGYKGQSLTKSGVCVQHVSSHCPALAATSSLKYTQVRVFQSHFICHFAARPPARPRLARPRASTPLHPLRTRDVPRLLSPRGGVRTHLRLEAAEDGEEALLEDAQVVEGARRRGEAVHGDKSGAVSS